MSEMKQVFVEKQVVLDEIKDIEIICAMKREEEEYSEGMMYDNDASYARGRNRGRYMGQSYNHYDRYGYGNGYAHNDEYSRMLQDATTEKERDLIRQLKEARRV